MQDLGCRVHGSRFGGGRTWLGVSGECWLNLRVDGGSEGLGFALRVDGGGWDLRFALRLDGGG